jgi:DNA-binding transcriptional LysR family regulator
MTIKELEEFCVICQRGSLARASKELFMSPQGLSRVLKNLENELECTLVNRTASGLELTESGERLWEYAEQSLEGYEKLKSEIETIRRRAQGVVELLMAYDVIRCLTPECILNFKKMYPNITFSYTELPDRVAERRLMEKKGNVALSVGPFQPECYDVRILRRCRLGLLVYEGHPLAARDEVSVTDLRGEPLYIENSQFKINELVQSQCWGQGFEPEIVFETNGFDLCYKMCRERKGISVTVDFIHEDMKTDGLVMIPFKEKEMIWEIGLLTEKDQVMESSVEQFCRFVENTMETTNG